METTSSVETTSTMEAATSAEMTASAGVDLLWLKRPSSRVRSRLRVLLGFYERPNVLF